LLLLHPYPPLRCGSRVLLLLLVLHAVTARYPASPTVPYLYVLMVVAVCRWASRLCRAHPYLLLLLSTLLLLPVTAHQPLSLPCQLHPSLLPPHLPPRCKWGRQLPLLVQCWMAVGGMLVLRVLNLNMSLVPLMAVGCVWVR